MASAGNRPEDVGKRVYPAAFDNVLGVSGVITNSTGTQWWDVYAGEGSNHYADNFQTYPVSGIYWFREYIDFGEYKYQTLKGTSDYQEFGGTFTAAPSLLALAQRLYDRRSSRSYREVWSRIVSTRDNSKARGEIAGLVDYGSAVEGW